MDAIDAPRPLNPFHISSLHAAHPLASRDQFYLVLGAGGAFYQLLEKIAAVYWEAPFSSFSSAHDFPQRRTP